MKIHILLGATVLALSLLSVEGFPRRGGHGHHGHNGGRHGAGRRRNSQKVCNLPPQTGMCYARMPMWFYNATSEACETFTYGGCGGNGNRFGSERACNRRCNDEALNPCSKPLDEGEECEDTTRSPMTLYYYDAEEDACKQFEYTGCGGNNNKFRSLNHCERRCLDDSSDSDDDAEAEGADEEIDGELDEDVEELLSDDEEDISDGDDEKTRIRRARRRRPRCHTARCRLRCPYGQEVLTDENGCVKCRCKQPRCPEVQRCAIFCEYGHEIDPVTGCETCTCKWPEVADVSDQDEEDTADETDGTALTRTTRSTRCASTPRCRMRCRNGYETDENGCAICRCKSRPTSPSIPAHCLNRPMCRMACRNGFQTGDDGCPICRCNPPPTSPSLPDGCRGRPMCRMACPNGFVIGKDGCPICQCKPTRPVRPTYPDHCMGRPMCLMYCATGFQTGEDGCPICRCNPPIHTLLEDSDEELAGPGRIEVAAAAGTDAVTESEDEEEEEEEITIVRRRRCHIPRCRMRCPFGYEKDEFGCAKCVCNRDPTEPREPISVPRPGGGNGGPGPFGCRLMYCYIPCLYGSRPDSRGCPTCDCLPDPSTVEAVEETEEEDATLEEAELRPAGTKCVQLHCFRPCRHGYELDNNGCETCRCRSAPGRRHRRSHPELVQGPYPCKPVLCPMDLRCPFGFKRDAQGCQSDCECRGAVRPQPERSDVCSLPKVVGPCFGAIPRFYFNSVKGECESFRFGGCRGNGNNFRSIEDCRERCEV